MTRAKRAPRRITLILDRRFKGVGRIKKHTGTTMPAIRKKLSRMLDDLADKGRMDLLRAIRDGHVTLLEVHSAYQRNTLDRLPVGATLRSVGSAMEKWINGLRVPADYSQKHVESLEQSRRYLVGVKQSARVAELPELLERLRNTLGKEHPRSFNLVRSAAMAFVRQTLKKNNPLWLACAAVEPRKVPKSTRRKPLTPEQMRNWFPEPATDPLDAIAWGMAVTGMYASEYWGKWAILSDRIHIEGTKRSARVRDVPLIQAPASPAWQHRRTFENAFRERTDQFSPIDLRRTYANWLESAGIPRTRRRMYMGHGTKDVTDLYETHEVAAFLVEDTAKLRAFLKIGEAVTDVRLEVVR